MTAEPPRSDGSSAPGGSLWRPAPGTPAPDGPGGSADVRPSSSPADAGTAAHANDPRDGPDQVGSYHRGSGRTPPSDPARGWNPDEPTQWIGRDGDGRPEPTLLLPGGDPSAWAPPPNPRERTLAWPASVGPPAVAPHSGSPPPAAEWSHVQHARPEVRPTGQPSESADAALHFQTGHPPGAPDLTSWEAPTRPRRPASQPEALAPQEASGQPQTQPQTQTQARFAYPQGPGQYGYSGQPGRFSYAAEYEMNPSPPGSTVQPVSPGVGSGQDLRTPHGAGWPSVHPEIAGQPGWSYPGAPQWVAPPPTSAPPPAKRNRAGWILLGLLAALLMTGMILTALNPTVTELRTSSTGRQPTAGRPTTTAPTTPTPGSSKPMELPDGEKDRLIKNPLYSLRVQAACPSQRVPSSQTAFRKQVKALVDCENKAWSKALSAISGVTFVAPTVKFYSTSTKSPCGRLNSAYPASYCTGDRTLYFSRAAYLQGRYYRTSVAQFVMHEYAHHVQELVSIFDSSDALAESAAVTTRRIELQAHCMAHYAMTHSSIGFGAADRRDAEYQFDYTTDARGHGSPKAERYWGVRGLQAGNVGACNTWKAKASVVK